MYCSKCGKELVDEAVICTNCGCAVQGAILSQNTKSSQNAEKKTSISMILGIIGLVFAWLFALVGHITSIIGIVIGIKEYKETDKMTGLTLSIIGEICSIFSSIIGAVSMSNIF